MEKIQFDLVGNYFNGEFHKLPFQGESAMSFTKTCPGDFSHNLWQTTFNADHVDQVVTSAEEGFQTWRRTSLDKRKEALLKFKEEVLKVKEEIALAIALETGKPLWESRTEAAAVAGKVDVTIGESLERVKDISLDEVQPQTRGRIIHKPLGVCLVVGPFNFPCHLANTQILSAILTGNSVIFKPSEKTIHSSSMLVQCFHRAGIPTGVINLFNGEGSLTQKLIKHPSVKGIFFTGSLPVGKKILESVGTDLTKLVALELGGKNSSLIHEDAQLDHAAIEVMKACFLSSGQRCTSTSLIFVHEKVFNPFKEKLVKLTQRIRVGHPLADSPEVFMGPVIDQQALEHYEQVINSALNSGAKSLIAHERVNPGFDGSYASPSILEMQDLDKNQPYLVEEVFGPNTCLIPYSDLDKAIEAANLSPFGLAASIFTQDLSVYEQCLYGIDSGLLNVNRSTVGASARLPFGGVKNSGNFRPAAISMIDHTVEAVASLETLDTTTADISTIKGLNH